MHTKLQILQWQQNTVILNHTCTNTNILDSPMCSCKSGEQTADHTLYDCKLLEQERDSLKAAALRTENWAVSKNKLINKFNKN